MNKKEYMKPAVQVEKIMHSAHILIVSKDAYGMSKRIVTDSSDDDYEEVDAGW